MSMALWPLLCQLYPISSLQKLTYLIPCVKLNSNRYSIYILGIKQWA